jgi:hypothetical protein
MRAWLLILAGILCATRPASAGAVFVVSMGTPSDDAARLLEPLVTELAKDQQMYAAPAAIRARLGDLLPRSGVGDPGLKIGDLVARMDAGYKTFKAGKYSEASEQLQAALTLALRNTALLVDQAHRDTLMNGLVALAMSRQRLKDPNGAAEAIRELARSFPNQEAVIRAAYGSEPASRYADAEKELDARGRGTLVVDVNDPTAVIYVDEWDHPQNATFEAQLLPGTYRVLVRMPGTDGRRYDALVEPNRTTHLSVDLKFDAAINVTDASAGLAFDSERDRDRYALDYARRLAAMLDAGNRLVVLASLTTWHERRAIEAIMYRLDTGAVVRRRVVPLDGHDDAGKLRALAHALLNSDFTDPWVLAPTDRESQPRASQAERDSSPLLAGWVLTSVAITAAATGGVLLYKHSSSSTTPGYACLGAGVALGAVATFLFLHDRGDGHAVTVTPTDAGASVSVGWRF